VFAVRARVLSHQPEVFEGERYEYYRKHIGTPREVRQTAFNERRCMDLLKTWAPTVRGTRLLDVGCGDGHLIHVANAAGWHAEGIDMASGAIELAQSWGIACRVLDFFDPSLDQNRYDVIHMSELIEHVPNPSRFIARAESLLAPGGLVYLTTPNFDSLARRVLQHDWRTIHFEHLSYFNERSLSTLVRGASGFRMHVESRNIAVPSIVRGAAQRLRGRSPVPAATGTKTVSSSHIADQSLRSRVYASPTLLKAMQAANRIASALRIGDTLVATLR